MNTKDYLNQISRLDNMIQNKLSEIMQYRELSVSLTAVSSDIKVRTSPNMDRIGSSIVRLTELEQQLDEMIDHFVDKKTHIIAQIDAMEDEVHYQILFARYIERKTFEKIALELNYSLRQISRVHEKALIEFEAKYGHEYLERK